MPLKSSFQVTTRASDLDSLRHVNNRIYEQFCSDGRYRLLEEHGYSMEALLDQAITLRPAATFVKFSLQQKADSTLSVQTEAFPLGNGLIFWNHHLTQADGKAVCHLQARTETLERRRGLIELLPAADDDPVQSLIEDVPAFSGMCSRVSSSYSANYTDMDPFGSLPIAAWWRIFEEGRHMSSGRLGLGLENLVRLDTHFFWVAGTYRYYRPIQAGQRVSIHTWLERIVRIRAYVRQEVWTEDSAELLGASREEHLIVSLREARPKTLPPEMAVVLQDYVEHRD